jgi:hypothetical protein
MIWQFDHVCRGNDWTRFLRVFVALLVAIGALATYALRGAQKATGTGGSFSSSDSKAAQPVITLLPPKERYTFTWDPTKAMYFDIQREGSPLPQGQWANPTFILHNSSRVAAADVVVSWLAEISNIKELAKSGSLAKYNVVFQDDYTMDMVSAGGPAPNFRYNPAPRAQLKIPYVARDADLFLPLGIYPILGLFVAAKMPSELGAKTEAFPIRVDVTWSVPDEGAKHFRIKTRATNTKPTGLSGPPEVVGYLEFEIENIQ